MSGRDGPWVHRTNSVPPPSDEAGWYEEPAETGWRYWDGKTWTGHWAPTDPSSGPSFVTGGQLGDRGERSLAPGWYDDPERPGSYRQRYWNGTRWESRTRALADQYGLTAQKKTAIWAAMRWGALLGKLGVLFAFIAIVFVLYVLFFRSGDSEDMLEGFGATTTQRVASAEVGDPSVAEECGPMLLDVAAGDDPCAAGSGEVPVVSEVTVPITASAVEAPGDCRSRTLVGGVDAAFAAAPVGAIEHAVSEFVIAPDCTVKVDMVWLEAGSDEGFVTVKNPDGGFCSMLTVDGSLSFVPDGAGGGSLSGELTVAPNIAPSHHFDGACPSPDQVGSYVAGPVTAEFMGSVSGGTLTVAGSFPHHQLPGSITVEASEG